MRLTLRHLNRATLERQGLLERFDGSATEVVRGLAGLQAQHANSPYIALWSRRANQRIGDLEDALHHRTVVKTTLMRSTLHLVAADDFPVLDVVTALPRLANWDATARRAGVDLVEMSRLLVEFCSRPRTVAEMEEFLADRWGPIEEHAPPGVRNVAFRMASAAGGLVHVPPSGLWKSHGKPAYVAASAWLGPMAEVDHDRAMGTVVERYLRSHGPATLGDIVKWAGLRKVSAVEKTLAEMGDLVSRLEGPDGVELHDLADMSVPDPGAPAPTRFLSRWDSILIAYHMRERILPPRYKDAVIKKNGDFLPTFLVDGLVAGLWSIEEAKDGATLTLDPFHRVPRAARTTLEEEAGRLARYAVPDANRHQVLWAT